MPNPTVPSEISSLLTNISKANTPLLPETFQDLDVHLLESTKTDQPENSRQSSLKSGVTKRVDHKNPRQPYEALSIFQSQKIFYAKHIPQSHTHMV